MRRGHIQKEFMQLLVYFALIHKKAPPGREGQYMKMGVEKSLFGQYQFLCNNLSIDHYLQGVNPIAVKEEIVNLYGIISF